MRRPKHGLRMVNATRAFCASLCQPTFSLTASLCSVFKTVHHAETKTWFPHGERDVHFLRVAVAADA
eukprot:4252180-Lingulodinium_polyedra.AAC.1